MDLGLRDRVYLVTGGSRGLGFAAAEMLMAEGARIVLSSPREATASAAAASLGGDDARAGDVTWVAADNGDPGTPDRLIAAARDRFSRLDGALISAGGTPAGTVSATTDEAWRSAFESVFLGAVRLARVLGADLASQSEDGAATATGTSGGRRRHECFRRHPGAPRAIASATLRSSQSGYVNVDSVLPLSPMSLRLF